MPTDPDLCGMAEITSISRFNLCNVLNFNDVLVQS